MPCRISRSNKLELRVIPFFSNWFPANLLSLVTLKHFWNEIQMPTFKYRWSHALTLLKLLLYIFEFLFYITKVRMKVRCSGVLPGSVFESFICTRGSARSICTTPAWPSCTARSSGVLPTLSMWFTSTC